jgi:uncharacterized protein (DUF1015 family)
LDALAAEVIAPPYDVLTPSEARALARDPRNFVRVTRAEVDLEEGADPHGDATYEKAAHNLAELEGKGVMQRDDTATYYFYGQRMGEHVQVGVLAGASVEEYLDGRIARHEFTRPDKEDDRTKHLEVLNAQVGLVFLAYRPTERLREMTQAVTETPPAWSVTTEDDVEHTLWVAPQALVPQIQDAFASVSTLYIADGHHRSAAAARVHTTRGEDATAFFLAGLYPSDSLQVMAYNRVVHDLAGRSTEAFMDEVRQAFSVDEATGCVPEGRGNVRMYVEGTWYNLRPLASVDASDPVASLDVSVLQDRLLRPVLGIEDPRRSERISFVGGIRGGQALEAAVDAGAAVAFHLHPTSLEELFAVADAGEVMPPKSTWFEPKLREGVAVRPLDER